jgi:hypothetical protein
MIREKMGEKRRCLSCNTAFFDLNHTKIVCPKCEAVFVVIEPFRSPPRPPGAFSKRGKGLTPPLHISTFDTVADIVVDNTSENADLEEADKTDTETEDEDNDA